MSRYWKLSTLEQRAAWLALHPELRGVPKKKIIDAMKTAGLVAPTTYWRDVGLPHDWPTLDSRA